MRVLWDCKYPTPTGVLRTKWYPVVIQGNIATVEGDGVKHQFTKDNLKKYFKPEGGSWSFMDKKKKPEEVETKTIEVIAEE